MTATPSPVPSAAPAPALPAGSATTQNVENLLDSLNDWQGNIFSLGFWNTLIFAAIVVGITFAVLWILRHFVKPHMGGNLNIFYRLIKVVVVIIAVSAILSTITPLKNLNIAIIASSGIAAVVLGLAAQQTLGNVFSGFSISVAKPFRVGEYIEILDTTPPLSGTVKAIGLRQTTIVDVTNKDIVIPNSVLDKQVIRTSHSLDESSISNMLEVNISYDSDIDGAIAILKKLVEAHPDALDVRSAKAKKAGAPRVLVQIVDLGDFAVRLRAYVWTKNTSVGFATLSDLRYSLKKEFAREGIEIPYPYQNVVMKK